MNHLYQSFLKYDDDNDDDEDDDVSPFYICHPE